MKQWYKVIDVAKCHDCNNCFMADKDEFVGNDWPGYTAAQPRHGHRWVDILRRERGQYARNDVAYLPVPCQHCENAPCIEASDGAIYQARRRHRHDRHGEGQGQQGRLVDSCPYGAIWWNEELDIAAEVHLLRAPASTTPPGRRTPPAARTPARPMAMETYFVEPEEMEEMIAAEGLQEYLPGARHQAAHAVQEPVPVHEELHHRRRAGRRRLLRGRDRHAAPRGRIACDAGGRHGRRQRHATLATDTNFFGEFKFDGLDDGEYTVEVDAGGKKYAATVTIAGESQNLGFIEL